MREFWAWVMLLGAVAAVLAEARRRGEGVTVALWVQARVDGRVVGEAPGPVVRV